MNHIVCSLVKATWCSQEDITYLLDLENHKDLNGINLIETVEHGYNSQPRCLNEFAGSWFIYWYFADVSRCMTRYMSVL